MVGGEVLLIKLITRILGYVSKKKTMRESLYICFASHN